MKRRKRRTATETLATRGGKVSIKSHSRRTRGGKRVVVRNYTRHAGRKSIKKNKPSSGTEFENLKNRSPYGEPSEKRLHTFQGSDEDTFFNLRRFLGDKITEQKRKVKKHISKDKELNKVEKMLDKFMRKNGYKYKKYL